MSFETAKLRGNIGLLSLGLTLAAFFALAPKPAAANPYINDFLGGVGCAQCHSGEQDETKRLGPPAGLNADGLMFFTCGETAACWPPTPTNGARGGRGGTAQSPPTYSPAPPTYTPAPPTYTPAPPQYNPRGGGSNFNRGTTGSPPNSRPLPLPPVINNYGRGGGLNNRGASNPLVGNFDTIAAVATPHNKMDYFRSDGTVARVDQRTGQMERGFPQEISNATWPGLGRFSRQIVAAFALPPGKILFLMSSDTMVVYDLIANRVERGYPRAVNSGLSPYIHQITGAVPWTNNKVQFFLDDGTYIRYDNNTDRVDPGYPKTINNGSWPGVGAYSRQITGAGALSSAKAMIFLRNGQYIQYDINADRADAGYPKPLQ